MTLQSKIYIAGHRGMVGSAIIRALRQLDQTNIVTRTHAEMVVHDLAEAKKHAVLKQHGYNVNVSIE